MQSTDTIQSQEKHAKNIRIVIKLESQTSLIKDNSFKKYKIKCIG